MDKTFRKTKRIAPLCIKYKLIYINIVNRPINISFFRDLKLHTGKHGRATIWTVQIFVKKTQENRFYLIYTICGQSYIITLLLYMIYKVDLQGPKLGGLNFKS